MPDSEVQRFVRAAGQRLTAASLLLGRANLDAMYLAGYVVECALKALLLAWTPRRQREPLRQAFFRGAQGHDLEAIKDALKKRGCMMPYAEAIEFRKIAWSPALRYEVGRRPYGEANAALTRAKLILAWVERSA